MMPTPEQLAVDAEVCAEESISPPLVFLASRLATLKDALERGEEARKRNQAEYDEVRKVTLPAKLAEAGLTRVRLPFGTLSLRHKTHASVRKDQQQAARVWCLDAGRGELLTVSPATAQAFTDECMENGMPLPEWLTLFTEEVANLTNRGAKSDG